MPDILPLPTSCESPDAVPELHEAAQRLAQTDRGRQTLTTLLAWLDDVGTVLDARHQDAVFSLLTGAWNGYAGSTREAMREALASTRDLTTTLTASIAHERQRRANYQHERCPCCRHNLQGAYCDHCGWQLEA